ncbi:MAG TPA: peptidoglycan-binding protein [Xanthobacteraceae bacterium]|jgi:TPR repeat protein
MISTCGVWLATVAALSGCPERVAIVAPILLAQTAVANIPPAPSAKIRGWIGAEIRTVDDKRARELHLAGPSGAEIVSLIDFGPAATSGLKPGDVVLSIDGEPLVDGLHLIRLISAIAPRKSAELLILRNTHRQTLKMTVGNYFEDQWAAAHRGNSGAMLHLGTTYAGGALVAQDHRQANDWFRKAADAGNPAAMNTLGDRYRFGLGFERDDREAIRWYRKAADAGSAESMFSLGLAYFRSQGVERDFAEAARWYRRAMEKGHAGAIHNYAMLLQAGDGMAKDEALAVTYFRKAAALNRPESFYMLGNAYLHGIGVARDPREAVRWYREATNRGVAHGYSGLAQLYESGEGGLPKNRAEAIKHYRKGAEAGHNLALERLKVLNASAHDPKEVQQLLSDLGLDPGAINGQPGRKTEQAIREFQKSRGLAVNGQASLALVGQLRNALKQRTAAASVTPAEPVATSNAAKTPNLGNLKDLEKLDSLQ